MAFSFVKTPYQNGVTVIYAENLNDIQDAILYLLNNEQVDTAVTAGSTNPVSGGAVATELDKKVNKTDVDAAMSDSSVNPVQNKVIGQTLKAGTQATAAWHLGMYLDQDGDLCQVD